jgi:DNA primase catalytic subunit
MRHFHVQYIVATYENPAQMAAEVLNELNASDIFDAPTRSVHHLQKTSVFITELCKLALQNKKENKKNLKRI